MVLLLKMAVLPPIAFQALTLRPQNMPEFDTGLPSVRQIQGYVKEQQAVEIKVITNDLLIGKLLWQDDLCLCLVDQYNHPTLVWRQAIVSLRPKA